MKEGSHDNKVMCAVPAGPRMRRATRAALDAWVGTGLVVVAAIMMKLSRFSRADGRLRGRDTRRHGADLPLTGGGGDGED